MIKKIVFVTVSALLILSVLAVMASANDTNILDELEGIIPDGVEHDGDGTVELVGVGAIFDAVLGAINGESGRIMPAVFTLFGLAILIAVADSGSAIGCDSIGKTTSKMILIPISVSIFSTVYALCAEVRDSLSSIADFFGSAIPVLTAVNAASASVSTAAVQSANMSITLSLMERLAVGALMPLCFCMFSLSFISTLSDGGGLCSVSRGVKSIFMWCVGIISTVLAAVISIQSVVASAKDSATLRAARYAASGTIPIVGTAVASALATLGGGMAVVRSTVGGSCIGVILALALSPLVLLLVYRLGVALCVALLEFCGSSGGVRVFSSFKSVVDCLIATYSVTVLVAIIEFVVFMKGGAEG